MIGIVLLTGFVSPVDAFEFGARGYYWITEIEGDVSLDKGGVEGTRIDVKDDLGLDDENFPAFEAFVGLGKHHLRFSFYNINYDGDSFLGEEIVFNGKTFLVGEQLDTDIDLDVYEAKYQYDMLDFDAILAGLSIGLVAKVQVLDGNIKLESASTETDEDVTQPIPYGGLNFRLGILADILEAQVLATAGYYEGIWFDGQTDLAFTPFPFLQIQGGYRIIYFDISPGDLELNDFSIAGPYAGAKLVF